MEARCSCGQVVLDVRRAPTARLFCHCTLCQKAYGGPFGDVTFLRPKDVKVSGEVDFRRYQYFPMSIRRGHCRECDDLIVEYIWPASIGLAMVPRRCYLDQDSMPPSRGHIFYETRVADVDDELPKLERFFRSQLFATRQLIPVLIGSTSPS
jgi:hypothetical protein